MGGPSQGGQPGGGEQRLVEILPIINAVGPVLAPSLSLRQGLGLCALLPMMTDQELQKTCPRICTSRVDYSKSGGGGVEQIVADQTAIIAHLQATPAAAARGRATNQQWWGEKW